MYPRGNESMEGATARSRERLLFAYVALGMAAGVVYAVFDSLSESRLERGTLTGALAGLHTLVDRGVPVLMGGLLGVAAHYFRLRAKLSLAEEAAARSEALRARLSKVERDQAVWVLAAAVLHELNNPLHALGLLLDELDVEDTRLPGASAETIDALRKDLVRRARLQAGRALLQLGVLRSMRGHDPPEFEDIALDGVVRAVAADVAALAAESGLVVRVDCEGTVRATADPGYVRTILENLLDNSLCSLREAGRGSVSIRVDMNAHRARIRVEDDGPELRAEVLAELFDPLRSTKTQGLGLGLPIARALARAMRGELSLDVTSPKSFVLVLPPGNAP